MQNSSTISIQSDNTQKIGVLFVCTANICRSPTAEAMLKKKVEQEGISHLVHVDSAATHEYKLGSNPDQKASLHAEKRGYDLGTRVARKVERKDLEMFDFVLPMDMNNLTILHRLGEPDLWQKPKLLMSYSKLYKQKEVPDPYGKASADYELALDMMESAITGLMISIKDVLRQRSLIT